ncbi:tyrosine-type recombinase/integrase [Spectribacter hydrogenoxidans]
MAVKVNRLIATNLRDLITTKIPDKQYLINDGGGLWGIVSPRGKIYWRFRYRWQGRPQMISLGIYPSVSLKSAREKRDEARENLRHGRRPISNSIRRAGFSRDGTSFNEVLKLWSQSMTKTTWGPQTARDTERRLQNHAYRYFEGVMADDVDTPMLARAIQLSMQRQHTKGPGSEIAHKLRRDFRRALEFAHEMGYRKPQPPMMPKRIIPPRRHNPQPAILDPTELGAFLRAVDAYQGSIEVVIALQISPHVFMRPGEIRNGLWTEVTLEGDDPRWVVPTSRMKRKNRANHIVPLSPYVVDRLRLLRDCNPGSPLMFPGRNHSDGRTISENSLLAAMTRMGYERGSTVTSHGFRHTATTLLNQFRDHHPGHADAIELQMAHTPDNLVRAVYHHAQYLEERRGMMHWWSAYLERLKAGIPDAHFN